MRIIHPECDIRDWLAGNDHGVDKYTADRILGSYDTIENVLERCAVGSNESAFDVGSGAGFDSFAIGQYFNNVVAIDPFRKGIAEARLIARKTGATSIRFERARAEKYVPTRNFDFTYCNLMSHHARSRVGVFKTIAKGMTVGGHLFYSEATEGYGPLEVHRAIMARNAEQLTLRLWQIISGLSGIPDFRFFASGTAGPILEAFGIETVFHDRNTWNGIVWSESLLCRRAGESKTSPIGPEIDYLSLNEDLTEFTSEWSKILSARGPDGFTPSQRTRLAERARDKDNRFAPYLIYLIIADLALPTLKFNARPSSRRERLLSKFGLGRALPSVDWKALEELDMTFIMTVRDNGGLKNDPIDD